jgi:hypothetical protein
MGRESVTSRSLNLADLRLPPTLCGELEQWGITTLDRLVLLAVAEMEGVSRLPDGVTREAGDLLEALRHALYDGFVTMDVPEITMSLEIPSRLRRYQLTVAAKNLCIQSVLLILEEMPQRDGDALRVLAVTTGEFTSTCWYEPLQDPFEPLRGMLDELPSREWGVLVARYGLDREPARSLQEIGQRLGVTRERARQLQIKATKHLTTKANRPEFKRLLRLVHRWSNRVVAPVDDDLVIRIHADAFPHCQEPVAPWLTLLKDIAGDELPNHSFDASQELSRRTSVASNEVLARNGPLPYEDLVARVAASLDMTDGELLRARIDASGVCIVEDDGTCRLADIPVEGVPDKQIRRLQSMVRFLEENGPSHFTHVASAINEMLPKEWQMSAHNVHSWLGRYAEHFAWVGMGTFGLRSQGVGHQRVTADALPEIYRPTRRRGVGDEIVQMLLERGPLRLDQIRAAILERFHVQPGSVDAAVVQDSARRFVLDAEETVRLRLTQSEHIRPAISRASDPSTKHSQRVLVREQSMAAVLPRARDVAAKIQTEAATGFAHTPAPTLFSHAVVAAVLGLEQLWPKLLAGPARPAVPGSAWAALDAARILSEETRGA